MTLHLCLDCAVLWDCGPEHERVCPRCNQPLGLQPEEPDNAPSLAEVASWALFGLPEHRRLKPNPE